MQLKANVTRRDKVLFSKHVFVKLNTCHHNSLLRIYTTLIMKVYTFIDNKMSQMTDVAVAVIQ